MTTTPSSAGKGMDAESRAEDAIRQAVLTWIKNDAPLAAKFNLLPGHVDALVYRIVALIARTETDGGQDAE